MILLELKKYLDDLPSDMLNKEVMSIVVLPTVGDCDTISMKFIERKTVAFSKEVKDGVS